MFLNLMSEMVQIQSMHSSLFIWNKCFCKLGRTFRKYIWKIIIQKQQAVAQQVNLL